MFALHNKLERGARRFRSRKGEESSRAKSVNTGEKLSGAGGMCYFCANLRVMYLNGPAQAACGPCLHLI